MIVFDLDGTLADCEHRRHFVDPSKDENACFEYEEYDSYGIPLTEKGKWFKCNGSPWKPDWKAFYEACDKDTEILPTCEILCRLNPFINEVAIWSGRCESVREKTEQWLSKNVFMGNFIATEQIELKMRPEGDNTPDDQLKEKWLDQAIAEGKTIEYVFDDRKKVIDMWRRRGIFVFDVSQGKGDF